MLQAESTVLEYQQKSVRAQASRAACWSLLSNARRHEAVTEALCESIAALAPHMLMEEKPAEPEEHARTAGTDGDEEDGDEKEAAATAQRPQKLTSAQVKRRLEVLPALLHLLGRMVVDAPPMPAPVAK